MNQVKPKAVIISDIHYSLQTLELADAALRQAVAKANELELPLIIAGDLHDTKANLRAECVNAMLKTFKLYTVPGLRPVVLRGNHDQINEKSSDHALNFLEPLCWVIDEITGIDNNLIAIPYHNDLTALRTKLSQIDPNYTIIMHQGIQGSDAGHYMQDPTALTHADVAHLNVISGHYHRRQTIKTGKGNTFSYIGNPYTLNFGESNDPEKGYQILNDDGTLTFVPTNLRKHVVIEVLQHTSNFTKDLSKLKTDDLVWVKVKGPKSWLHTFNRHSVETTVGFTNFRLDFIANDEIIELGDRSNQSQSEILDGLIDALPDEVSKEGLKALWRSFNEANKGAGN